MEHRGSTGVFPMICSRFSKVLFWLHWVPNCHSAYCAYCPRVLIIISFVVIYLLNVMNNCLVNLQALRRRRYHFSPWTRVD